MQKLTKTLLGLCVGASLLAPVLGLAEALRIGVGGPFSGPYAAFGEQMWRGAEMAVQDINQAGGVNGNKIDLLKGDDACEPKQAVAVANRFVDKDGVKAVVGHFCSASTIPATQVYAEGGVLAITPGSTNPLVTDRNLSTVFRTCGRDDQQGKVGAEFLLNRMKLKKIAVVHDKTTYGQGLANAMRERMHQLGVTEVLYEGITQGEKDFNALVTKIKSTGAEAVYFGGLHSEAGPMVRQIREQGMKIPFVSGDGVVSKDLIISAGGPSYLEGVYMTFGADPRKLPEGQSLVERFRKSGYEPEGYTLYAYATMQAIVAAMQATKSNDAQPLADWLHKNTVTTVMGPKAWDAKGDLTTSDYVVYQWDNKGNYAEMP
ncbi:MAG: branched-chain amino acid ABC transporter substrate-binding protein [Magnetococcales bacterium]|nr:branched-chain amino acid ABC transporter substrate-binding protein [Magnetococcales bacterium]